MPSGCEIKMVKMKTLSYSFVNWMDRAKERFSECTNKSVEKIQIDTKEKGKRKQKYKLRVQPRNWTQVPVITTYSIYILMVTKR